MNKLFLNMVMLPQGLWRSMGADVDQLRNILHVRLMLDDRKPMGLGRPAKVKKDRKHISLISVFVFAMLGFFYMFPLTVIHDRIFSLTIYFSLLLSVMTLMLITDFSSVLFDARDKYILFHRPVADSTLVLARMLHVFIYLFRIIVPISLPGWVALGITDGWKSAVLFPLPLLLMVFMALFLVNGVYLLVLRLAKPEKFKDVINYFQMITSVVFFATVYLMPRMFDSDHPLNLNIIDHPWLRFAPPYWLAVCWSWIGYPVALQGTAVLSIGAIVLPVFCAYAMLRWLAPQFSRRIAGIDAADTSERMPVAPGVKVKAPGSFYRRLGYLLNRSDDARAGFMIAWLQTSRSRSFRMRVYPTFAYVPVYFVYLLTSNKRSFADTFHNLGNTKLLLLLLYMSSFVMISALTYLSMSDQYKAAWVYYSTPVETPGQIMLGAFKAIWVKYFMPFFIVISVFVLYVWGAGVIWDIVLAFVNVTVFVSCIARISHRHLPFSIMEQMKQGGGRILKSFAVMIIPAALGFGHYFALNLLWLKLLFMALSAVLLWLVWDSYSRVSWVDMIKGEE